LVTEYVYSRKTRKPNASIFWVTATSEESIDLQVRRITEQLFMAVASANRSNNARHDIKSSNQGAPHGQAEDIDVHKQPTATYLGEKHVLKWMVAPGHEDWLLVLDNLDDIRINVRRFLPVEAVGSVIITTRDPRLVGSITDFCIPLIAVNAQMLSVDSSGSRVLTAASLGKP